MRILVSVHMDPVQTGRLVVTYNPHPKRWKIEGKSVDEIVRELDETIAKTQAHHVKKAATAQLLRAIQSELQLMIDSMVDAQYIVIRDQSVAELEAELVANHKPITYHDD